MSENKRNTNPVFYQKMEGKGNGSRYGLFIGVSAHKNPDLNLNYADKDAGDVCALFTDPEIGGMAPDHAVELCNEKAGGQDIKIALENLTRKSGKDDDVVIFFAGHTTIHEGKGYWVPYDGDINYPEATCISPDYISSRVAGLQAQRILVFIDSCHAATQNLKDSKLRYTGPVKNLRDMLTGEGKFLFASCTGDQQSVESKDKGHGVFTYALLDAINGNAVSDHKDYLDSDDLWTYLKEEVKRLARQEGGKQDPIRKTDDETDSIFITKNPLAQERHKRMTKALGKKLDERQLSGSDYDLLQAVWQDRGKKDKARQRLYENLEMWDRKKTNFQSLKLALDNFKDLKDSIPPPGPQSPKKPPGVPVWALILFIIVAAITGYVVRAPSGGDSSDLARQVKIIKADLVRVSEQRDKLADENARLEKLLAGDTGEKFRLLSEKKKLETALSASGKKIQDLTSTIRRLEKVVEELSGHKEEITKDRDGIKKELAAAVKDKNAALAGLGKVKAELAGLEGKIRPPRKPKIDSLRDPLTGASFVSIKPGSFMMGSPDGEAGRDDDETRHKVTLTKGFYMQTTEVTQAQWEKVMGENPSWFQGVNLPVERVSWDDVQVFISKLNRQSKTYTYRLPTEAEWEYACRSGSTGRYSFGENEKELVKYAWYDKNAKRKTHPVGQLKPNSWGLYDMYGNVWEWCSDGYDKYPSNDVTNPKGNDNAVYRVFRGGSWFDGAGGCRSAVRRRYSPGDRSSSLGLRLVLLFSGQN